MRSTLERMRQPRMRVGRIARNPVTHFLKTATHVAAAFGSGHPSVVFAGRISPLPHRVKRKSRIALAENSIAPQRAELLGEILGAAMLGDHLGVWR